MALWLAVVVSQAPGFGGTPSAGQRATAVANASAAASSAMSRSPNRLVRAATRENPVALGDQSFVERADGRLPVRAAGIALVVDHGNQVLHLGSSPVVLGRPSWAATHPCYEHICPDPTLPRGFLSRTFRYA